MAELPASRKKTHESVHYGRGMPSKHCSICRHYIPATKPRCEHVRSPIDPKAWCVLYERR